MNTIIKRLSLLMLLTVVVACSGQSASAPAPAPTAAPTRAQPAAPAPASLDGTMQRFEITLTTTDMKPGEITVKAGSQVHFIITNKDQDEEHNLVNGAIKLKEIRVFPKQIVEADWSVPDKPGDYEVPCSIHREITPLLVHIVP